MSFPRIIATAVCTAASVAVCFSQTPVNFSLDTSTSGRTPSNIYPVDLNNDGITDLIQDTYQMPSGFSVTLAKGDGAFKAPVFYSLPTTNQSRNAIATGDFNNDGKVDVAVTISGTNEVLVYLGNGDGTLQAPKKSTIAFPSSYGFTVDSAAAADFNADGKLDLAASATSGSGQAMYVLQGDGTGGFVATPHIALTGIAQQAVVGDFDADGKADIATTIQTYGAGGYLLSTTVHVLYGNGAFGFTDTTPYINVNGSTFYISAGDLNSDGITDIFGTDGDGTSRLVTLYGTTGRTFNSYFSPLPAGYLGGTSLGFTPLLTMGDYNGDGRMDIAAFNYTSPTSGVIGYNFAFFLATTSPGQFTIQTQSLPAYSYFTSPVSGLFSGHLLPDIAMGASDNGGAIGQTSLSNVITGVNRATSGYFGSCYYPSTGQGFNVCSAGAVSGNSATFSTAVNSYGKLRKIELWVDGKKLSEQYHAWDQHGYFSYSTAFAQGTHKATFFAGDVDNRLQRYDFTFTVGSTGGCSAASGSGNGVYICSPSPVGTVPSPVQVTATANITGTLARMELWIDGTNKVYTETTSLTLSTTIALSPGRHDIAVAAVNTAGTKWGGYSQVTVK